MNTINSLLGALFAAFFGAVILIFLFDGFEISNLPFWAYIFTGIATIIIIGSACVLKSWKLALNAALVPYTFMAVKWFDIMFERDVMGNMFITVQWMPVITSLILLIDVLHKIWKTKFKTTN